MDSVKDNVIVTDWHGLYRSGWQGIIVPEAFQHPAKFARDLIAQIYDHCRAEGWLRPNETVLDPFAGVGLGALDAMRIGCHWTGVELEAKFVTLAEQNLARWAEQYGSLPTWGSARILQGDSRRLTEIILDAGCCVSSPPYADSVKADGHGIDWSKVGPATGNRKRGSGSKHEETLRAQLAYSSSPLNLGNLPDRGFAAAVGSPPFSPDQPCASQTRAMRDYHAFTRGDGTKRDQIMRSPGQLAALPGGRLDACVSSPPYETGGIQQGNDHHPNRMDGSQSGLGKYPGNTSSIDTFWSASRQILEQMHAVLRPGAHAVWVLKGFIRRRTLVDFPDQWRQLCEAVGFRTLHLHRAWLVEDHGTQQRIDGGETRHRVQRKSFFRRIAEAKGSPAIDYETVLCMERVEV